MVIAMRLRSFCGAVLAAVSMAIAGLAGGHVLCGASALAQDADPPAPTDAAPTAPAAAEQQETRPATAVAQARFNLGAYRLSVGDQISVEVVGEDSLSTETTVEGDGQVNLPLIGRLAAADLDVAALEGAVEAALRDGYLNNPVVNINVLTLAPITVIGEVQMPGEYPYRGELTLMSIVARAGGFGPMANQTRVAIRAAGAETAQEFPLSLSTVVAPGDEIRILKAAFYILGEVNRPGEYRHADELTAMNAVAMAQGFTTRANQTRVLIQRAGEREERAYRLTPDLRIYPGDTVRIAERYF